METTTERLLAGLQSATVRWLLLALTICTPLHVVHALAPTPNSIAIAGGDNQSGYTNSQLPNPLSVSFSNNSFVASLEWKVTGGSATFQNGTTDYIDPNVSASAPPPTTASVNLNLGATAGQVTVQAICTGCGVNATQTLTFSETVTTRPPALQMQIVSGNNQAGPPNTTLPARLIVQTISGPGFDGPFTIPLQWQVESGTATFTANHSQSYSQTVTVNRNAAVSVDLGATPGPVVVSVYCAACTSGKTRLFHLTIAAASSTLLKISGDNQSGAAGNLADVPLVVQLGASGGTSLSGQPISWSVISGQATLSASTSLTDSNGRASITFSYGSSAGPIAIQASAPNTQVTFNETAFIPSVSTPSGNNQAGVAGSALQPFLVQVIANGKGVPGINVTWSILQGGGTLAAATTLTDANGNSSNTLTLGPSAGVNIIQATIAGIGSIIFTATASAVIASDSQFTVVSGNNQALIPGQASQPLIVKLISAQGQPVSDANVLWSVSGSSGALTSQNTLTDTSGQAKNQLTVILPGSYTVTAQLTKSPTTPALIFSFNNAVANLPALTPGQIAVAHAIDQACPALAAMAPAQLTTPQHDLLQRCSEIVVRSGSNPQQVPNALDQMLNNKALPQRQLASGVQLSQFDNLNTRLAELRQGATGISVRGLTLSQDGRGLPLAMLGDQFRKDPKQDDEVGKGFERWGFFASGMIERGGFDAVASRPGFDFHNASLTAGVDYRFNANFVAGLAFGYNQNHSSLDANAGKLDVNGYSLNGYFTWYHNDDFYIEGSGILNWLNYDLNRNIVYQIDSLSGSGLTSINQTASASPTGHDASLSLSLGKDFSRKAWTFSPYVRGVYSHLNLGGFSETFADPNSPGAGLGTSVESRSLTSELGVLGGRVSYTTSFGWGVLVPNAVVEWNHEFRSDPQTVVTRFLADPTQTPIVLNETAPDQNYFNLGIGLNAILPQGRSGYFYYEHLVGFAGAHENRFSLGIRIEF